MLLSEKVVKNALSLSDARYCITISAIGNNIVAGNNMLRNDLLNFNNSKYISRFILLPLLVNLVV